MAVTNDQVAALRAYLAGDFAKHRQLMEQLGREGAREGFAALVPAAFVEAAERRFPPGTSMDEITSFVALVRAQHLNDPDEIDPLIAERLIHDVSTGESIGDLNPDVKYRTQFVLLYPLIVEGNFSEAGLDDLVAEARKLAEEWLR
jgi:hypothetical protein